jgi:hypothetical protein
VRALGHHDDGERAAAALARLEHVTHRLEPVRFLRDHDVVGAPSHPAHGGDPAGSVAHHLDHHHALMALGGGVKPLDRLAHGVDRGVEAEAVVGPVQVVVDRLRDAHRTQPEGAAVTRRRERALAADHDQAVGHERHLVLEQAPPLLGAAQRVDARGPEDRAALGQDVGDRLARQRLRVLVEQAQPSVAEAENFHAVLLRAPHDRANHRVQARTIAATRQDPELLRHGRVSIS